MNEFTKEDLKNLILLLSRSVIEGKEAMTVVGLQQKIHRMMTALQLSQPIPPSAPAIPAVESEIK